MEKGPGGSRGLGRAKVADRYMVFTQPDTAFDHSH
jgi:hypothetical protein